METEGTEQGRDNECTCCSGAPQLQEARGGGLPCGKAGAGREANEAGMSRGREGVAGCSSQSTSGQHAGD